MSLFKMALTVNQLTYYINLHVIIQIEKFYLIYHCL